MNHRLSTMAFYVLVASASAEGAEIRVTPAVPVSCLGNGAESYLHELLGRIGDLERKLQEEEKARLAERTDSARLLKKERTEQKARVENMAGELRSRAQAVDSAHEATATLRASRAECGQALEAARSASAALEERASGLRSQTETLTKDRDQAEARLKAAEDEAAKKVAEQKARLENMAGELRSRGQALDSAHKATAKLRTSSAECGQALEMVRSASAALEERASGLRSQTETLTKDRDQAAAKLKAVEDEAAKKIAVSEQATAALQVSLESRTKEVAALKEEVEKERTAERARESEGEGKQASALQREVEHARAEIARLNQENLEQQGLIDELTSNPRELPRAQARATLKAATNSDRRGEVARARKAPPISEVSIRGGDSGSRRATDSLAEELAQTLTRRDKIQRTIEMLKGSPGDASAPGQVAELQAELETANKEVLRLTVLMSELLPSPH